MSLNLSESSNKKECDLVMKGGITSGIVYPPLVIKLHDEGYSFRKVGGSFRGAGFYSVLSVLALISAVVVTAVHLYLILTRSVPRNYFGICTGRGKNPGQLTETALTDWLTVKINELAGKAKDGDPLTFGELWAQTDSKSARKIDLRMMTSNLSQNRPYILPFDDVYLFKRDELVRLFPDQVVNHMVKHQRVIPNFNPPAGYFLFPEAKDLPVVVATRMSLSFPVLISMVPLYTIGHNAFKSKVCFVLEQDPDYQDRFSIVLKEMDGDRWVKARQPLSMDDPEKGLQRCWFSDGGICSNFPIHFFDSWLPTRPTFGVNLTSQLGEKKERAAGSSERASAPQVADPRRFSYMAQQPHSPMAAHRPKILYSTDVYLPQPGSEAMPEWIPFGSDLVKFLGSIFSTAQNYRDNMQAMLPSYYERIVQIRLSDEEGGLNLEMPPEIIEEVVKKGTEAGNALATEFSFSKHQWVRFRVLMGQMEKALRDMDKAMKLNQSGVRPFDYMNLMIEQSNPADDFPYVRAKDWCDNASERIAAMGKVISMWTPPDLSKDPPLPEPVLRVAPEV